MGMMVERLKQEGISHNSRDLLKICEKMGASSSAQVFRQAGVTPSGPGAFVLSEDLAHVIFTDLKCTRGGGGVAGGVNGCVDRWSERVWGVSNLQ